MHVLDVSRFRVITNTENETEVPTEPCPNCSKPWPDNVTSSDDDVLEKIALRQLLMEKQGYVNAAA